VRVDLPAGISRHDLPILVAAAIEPASAGSRVSRATAGWAYANVGSGLASDVLRLAGSHSDGGFPLSSSVDRRGAATSVGHSLWYYQPPGGPDSYINEAQFLGTVDASGSARGNSLTLGLYDATGNMVAGDSLTGSSAAQRVTLAPSKSRARPRSGRSVGVAAITLNRGNPTAPSAGFGYVGTALLYLSSQGRPKIVSVRPTKLPLKVKAGGVAQVTVTAESAGLGVRQIELTDARGRPLAQSTIACAATNADPCPARATRTLRVDWGQLTPGHHELRVVALDPSGDASVALTWGITIRQSRLVGVTLGTGQHPHLSPTCTDTWTNGGGDGNWATATNWSTGVVPGDGDYACVPVGDQVTVNSGTNDVGQLDDEGTLVLSGSGTLSVDDASASSTIATLNQSSGTLTGAGELDVSGSWSWTGGTQSGSGSTVIDSGASTTVNVGPGGRVWLDTRTLVNQGTMTLSSGSIQGSNGGTIENQNTFYLNSEDTSWGSLLNWYSGAVPQLINSAAGLVEKSSGSGTSPIGFSVDDSGTLDALSGQLSFPNSGASSTLENGSTLLGTIAINGGSVSAGSVQSQNATVDLQNGYLTMTGAAGTIQTFNQSGGTVNGSGELDVSGSWSWTGGTQSGSGSTVIDSGASTTVNVGPGGRVWLDTRTLVNQGTMTLSSGSIQGSNGGTIENQNTFYLNSEDTSWGSPLNWYSGTPPWLINAPAGLVEKSNGNGTSPIGFWFENQGTTDGMSGTLSIPSGAWATSWNGTTLQGTIAINGGTFSVGSVQGQNATVDLQSGTLNMSAGTGNVGTFNQTGGTVNGPGELDVCGSLNLASGTMSGMGATVICQGAQASLGGSGQVTLNQRSLVNHGTLTWEGGAVQAENGSVLWNANQLIANAENTSFSAYGEAMLYNTGSISKIAGTGQTEFDPLFFNQGSAPSATTGQIIFRGLNADSYDGDDDTADTRDSDASSDGSQTGIPGTCSEAADTLVQDYIYLASGATEVVAGQAGVECPAGALAASTGSTIYEQNPSGGGNLALANSGTACSQASACIDALGAVLVPGATGYVDPTTPETFEGVADFEYSGGTSGPTEIDVAYPPPGLTQRVLNLANALETQNPGTIDDNNKLELAQECLELEDAATGNTDTSGDSGDVSFTNCKGLPIFVSGADVREATNHDLAALGWPINDPWMGNQAVNPGWAELEYRPRSEGGNPKWKNNLWPCTETQSGQNCDEFPFLATAQGGGSASPLPNLEPIDAIQNQQQGSFYSAFLSNCGISQGSTPPEFLVVPVLPQSSTPTLTNVCNGW
jgi:hypothetical protein